MGRKSLSGEGETKRWVKVRTTKETEAVWRRAAELSNKPLGVWLRELADRAARRIIRKHEGK